ncbi:MAG: dependent methyl transferase [Ilumatobacteraceae bacterium]|nr:dependent methyl transferase [Ilumatobacteraceae bacterium]
MTSGPQSGLTGSSRGPGTVAGVPMPTVILRPGRERSLNRRHPWIFSGGVGHVTGDPRPGDTVAVQSVDHTVLGLGAYSPASQIRVRMWTFDGDTEVDDQFVHDRIIAAAARRDSLLSSGTNAARLVFSEADGVPGLIADRYGDTIIVQLTTAGADARREVIADALASIPGINTVFERSDADIREREALEPRVGLLRGTAPAGVIIVEEGPWR